MVKDSKLGSSRTRRYIFGPTRYFRRVLEIAWLRWRQRPFLRSREGRFLIFRFQTVSAPGFNLFGLRELWGSGARAGRGVTVNILAALCDFLGLHFGFDHVMANFPMSTLGAGNTSSRAFGIWSGTLTPYALSNAGSKHPPLSIRCGL